jgi:hypothetical protein|tara:strand:+ start:716 stop:1015 length:300 start_codon:yes stop_codon:yes gene_type:complete
MSEEVKNFIDKIADGDNAGAGDAFKDALRVKVGDQLDNHRKDLAGNLFNGVVEAEPHSDPKPEIADAGTFNQDGSVSATTNQDGQAQIDLTQGGEDAGK